MVDVRWGCLGDFVLGALSLSLQKSSKGQFLILVPSAADLERVARNLVTEWRALHDTEIQVSLPNEGSSES